MKFTKLKDSISFRILIICIAFAGVLIFIANSFIFDMTKSAILSDKKSELISSVSEYSTALSKYGFSYNINFMNATPDVYRRVIITDSKLKIIYDSSDSNNSVNKISLLASSVTAIKGKEYSSFNLNQNSIFESCVSTPIVSEGKIIGTVSIFETDHSLAHIFNTFKKTFTIFSLIIVLLILICAFLLIYFLSHRISDAIDSIHKINQAKDFNLSDVHHKDELSPIICEFNDLHERVSYAQQMRQAFVSDASHELRTPLAAIHLLCESITQTDDIPTEMVREFMEDIITEVDRMSHTAEKLLVLSKLDNNAKKAFSPISLTAVVNKMLTALTPLADAKNITIESYVDDNCSILGDMEGANQIISNLIDNAIKYNNVGGILRVYLFEKNNHCTFITDDTGIGIAPEFREQVFERFYRIDKSREHDGRGGSGLGLAIVKRNIESFGGTIEISDSVHGGTRFTVVIPALSASGEVS